jgi:hypothetical protein
MNRGNYLIIILLLIGAVVLGGYLVSIGWVLFNMMLGLLGIGLLVAGFYFGRWTKK